MASNLNAFANDYTLCPICLEDYVDPRSLPCLHTFCLKCIELYCRDKLPGAEATCPLCRRTFEIPQQGVGQLKRNSFADGVVQAKKAQKADPTRKTSKPVCNVCYYLRTLANGAGNDVVHGETDHQQQCSHTVGNVDNSTDNSVHGNRCYRLRILYSYSTGTDGVPGENAQEPNCRQTTKNVDTSPNAGVQGKSCGRIKIIHSYIEDDDVFHGETGQQQQSRQSVEDVDKSCNDSRPSVGRKSCDRVTSLCSDTAGNGVVPGETDQQQQCRQPVENVDKSPNSVVRRKSCDRVTTLYSDIEETTCVKVTVVGDVVCEKTTLIKKFCEYVPTDLYTSDIQLDGRRISLVLWDTAGQEYYEAVRSLSYPNTDVVLLCFSVDSPASFENINAKWLPEVRHFLPRVPVILVGTKKDLRVLGDDGRASVSVQKAQKLADDIGAADYVECSASTGEGVQEVFEKAARAAIKAARESRRSSKCPVM